MYSIKEKTVSTILKQYSEKSLRLPRFQRKLTWKEIDNFKLCISVFNSYPIGSCIVHKHKENGKDVDRLLDGRQRINALLSMNDNPVNIYDWAAKFAGFNSSNQPDEVGEIIDEAFSRYLESEGSENEETTDEMTNQQNYADQDDFTEDAASEMDDVETDDLSSPVIPIGRKDISNKNGLDLLKEVIVLIHKKTADSNGFTKFFNFKNHMTNKDISLLPYCENYKSKKGEEKTRISASRLKVFIDEYEKYCQIEELDISDGESFFQFFMKRCKGSVANEAKLKKQIAISWDSIYQRIKLVDRIREYLDNATIGVIEVTNVKIADAQKIFNIINTEGQKLTAVEILAAKPRWTIKVKSASDEALEATKELYKRIGTGIVDDVSRWDLPATFMQRLGKNLVYKDFTYEKADKQEATKLLGQELTCGFKLLAAIRTNAVTKEDIDRLSNEEYEGIWNTEVEQDILNVRAMLDVLKGSREAQSYFKYLNSWNVSIMELTSDYIALNFVSIAYLNWKKCGKPRNGDASLKKFTKNCFILWDRLIYEYVSQVWKGSGDSKVKANIAQFNTYTELFPPVSTDSWKALLEDIFDDSIIGESTKTTVPLMKPLLYHFYCIREMLPPNLGDDGKIEVDHIIPQEKFKNSTISGKDYIQDNLLNLGLLPKSENGSKGKQLLNQIKNDRILVQYVEKYEFVKESDFEDFSLIYKYQETIFGDARKELFYKTFGDLRQKVLDN